VPGEAATPQGVGTQLVRAFGTYTLDLQALSQWFRTQGITTVALESTGVYAETKFPTIPLFETLEAQGFTCLLMSARALRRVPGKKSDITDAQWIQTLHQYGLLAGSFRPEGEAETQFPTVALRTLLRHRAQLLEHRAPHILHMQKALLQTCTEPVEV
jgi:transposase